MAVKKSSLYNKIWESCDTLRSKGGMDATQYKDYVLIILFIKVITDKYYGKKKASIIVPENANFNTMIALKGKKEIGESFNEILQEIAEKNDLKNVIDVVDFNDETKLGKGKDKIDALTGLVEIFQNPELDFSNNRADDNDVLGDAYEYLMKKFATEAGKSKGQFYTPSEVSRVMAKIIGINKATKSPIYVYDMTCGSGSLLIKAGAEAKDNIKVELYGQEKDNNTAGLAVMNMFLHGNPSAIIKTDNTLTKPQFLVNGELQTFDFCVANPPFSIKKWSSGMENDYGRFVYGTPPDNCADYAFLLHMLKSMNPKTGRGAIILPHGVLFRGGLEAIIRKNIILNGFIESIIGLPENLFYGTGIPACIIVLDMQNRHKRDSIFIIDASKKYVKDGNKNKLREEDIKKIVDTYLNKKEEDKYSKKVSIKDIATQDYNLNIPRYINSNENFAREDILAHLKGGIPFNAIDKFKKYWLIAPNLKNTLFKNNIKPGYYDLNVAKDSISLNIKNSEEINKYNQNLNNYIKKWENLSRDKLTNISNNTSVKDLIEIISEEILKLFEKDKLIDKYDAYEYFMEYFVETMKDDWHMIIENGWIPQLVFNKNSKGEIKKNDFDSYLLPKAVVIEEFFKEQNNCIKEKLEQLNDLIIEFNTIVEDNTGETLLFNSDEKVNEKSINQYLKEDLDAEAKQILLALKDNIKNQKELRKNINTLQEELNKEIVLKYNSLDVLTSKRLIIENKWFKSIENIFNNQFKNIIFDLESNLLKEIENYENTLDDLIKETTKLEDLVLQDLQRMGYK